MLEARTGGDNVVMVTQCGRGQEVGNVGEDYKSKAKINAADAGSPLTPIIAATTVELAVTDQSCRNI